MTDPAHDDRLDKVAAVGDPAPGTPNTFSSFSQFTLSDTGLIAFNATTLISNVHTLPGTTTGIWLGHPGDLHLLLQSGEPLTLPDGQTVFPLSFQLLTSSKPFTPLRITDDGRLLVNITYRTSDSSPPSTGLFLLSLPEPTCLSLLLLPTLLLPRRRRTQPKFSP